MKSTYQLIFFAVFFCISNFSIAQSKVARSGDWNNANTWSPSGVPRNNEVILIPVGVTVTVRGTDHTLTNSILVVRGVLNMETTCMICLDYGSLTFNGTNSGVIIEDGGRVVDGSLFGGDTHFIQVQGTTSWSGNNCYTNCGTVVGDYTSIGETAFPYNLINPLPVELISFNACLENEIVLLTWETASEQNNSHFIIERSFDAIDFVEVGMIGGSGTTTELRKYMFEDIDRSILGKSKWYYRLKQVDYDGQYEYFNVIAIYNDSPLIENKLSMQSNPFKDKLTLQVNSEADDHLYVCIFDLNGRLYFKSDFIIEKGAGIYTIEGLDKLENGIYLFHLKGDHLNYQQRIIKSN